MQSARNKRSKLLTELQQGLWTKKKRNITQHETVDQADHAEKMEREVQET